MYYTAARACIYAKLFLFLHGYYDYYDYYNSNKEVLIFYIFKEKNNYVEKPKYRFLILYF